MNNLKVISIFLLISTLFFSCSSGSNPSCQSMKLDIRIESDQDSIIQGQLWGCFVYIKNNSNQKVSLRLRDCALNIYHQEADKFFQHKFPLAHYATMDIEPGSEYIESLQPFSSRGYNEVSSGLPGVPWYYWYTGHYKISFSYDKIDSINSNTISLTILTVPDSLINAFNGLKFDLYRNCVGDECWKENEVKFQTYKNTLYKKEYLYNLFLGFNYYNALEGDSNFTNIRELVIDRYKNFILDYPNSPAAITAFDILDIFGHDINQKHIEEVQDSLRDEKYLNTKLFRYVTQNYR